MIKKIIVPLLIAVVALAIYLFLPSSYYNPDGLRVFPSLRYVKVDSTGAKTYLLRSWRTGYQEPYFFQQNVQKHLLFPLYAFFSYCGARLFGYKGNGLRPIQVANAFSGAVALGLFALFLILHWERAGSVLSRGGERSSAGFGMKGQGERTDWARGRGKSEKSGGRVEWLGLAVTAGLAFSNAFSSMATDIAEVVSAIPWLVLGLVFLQKRQPLLAGVALGISAAFYLVSLSVVAVITIGLFIYRQFSKGITFVLTSLLVTLIFYFGLLFLARGSGFKELWNILTFFPEQGTFGGVRALNFLTVFVGFTNSILPVLPDDFSGMRDFIALGGYRPYFIFVVLLFGVSVFLFSVISEIRTSRGRGEIPLGLLVLFGALIISLYWAPYHPKIWIYSNIGLWLMLGDCLKLRNFAICISRRAFLIAIFLICGTNILRLVSRADVNQKLLSAKEIDRIVTAHRPSQEGRDDTSGEGLGRFLLLGDWEPEFGYLTLFLPEHALVSLPDLILQNHKDSAKVWSEITTVITGLQEKGGEVYFVNLFNYPTEKLKRFYGIRLQSPWFLAWVEKYHPLVHQVWQDERTGIALFRLDKF